MTIAALILIGWAAMAVVMAALWLVQRRRRNAGIVDIAWSFGTGLVAIWFAWGAAGYEPRRLLIGVLAGLWGARLGLYLVRRVAAEPEDGRYQELRRRWGRRTQPYLFVFFQVQAAWAVLFALPMLVAAWNPRQPLGWLDAAGTAIWLIAVAGESLADRQLARFRRDPNNRGLVCRQGLWRYSRNPNYFFEWVHWWAYVLIGITGPWGWLTLLGPALMLLFITTVTGIPPTERRALESRGEAYRQYQQTTSALFPLAPETEQTGMSAVARAVDWIERGRVPDPLVRLGIRRMCRQRLREESGREPGQQRRAMETFVSRMGSAPIAPVPQKANEQHYELPPAFFRQVLGRHLKYSCCHWPAGAEHLDEAEASALEITADRAGIEDGQEILELGCGWGSLTLWMARRCPGGTITAVSNSHAQRRFIEARAAEQGLVNVQVVTADMNDFDTARRFDRVVSVEMFEHMRNYRRLLEIIAGWLRPDGRLFVHVFCHRRLAYEFSPDGPTNWMGRHFFSGGIMPSADLLLRFDEHLQVVDQWSWGGEHYRRTADAWLANLDRRRATIRPILAEVYGTADADRWLHRWRVFFMACSELFGFGGGREWMVGHYLLAPRGSSAAWSQGVRR